MRDRRHIHALKFDMANMDGLQKVAVPVIRIAVAVVTNTQGQVLLVRKRGTDVFIQPGGKIETGEEPVCSLRRELREELGVAVEEGSICWVGEFEDSAANEPGHRVNAQVYRCRISGEPKSAAVIEEIIWINPYEPLAVRVGPLSRLRILPRFAARFR